MPIQQYGSFHNIKFTKLIAEKGDNGFCTNECYQMPKVTYI